MLIYWDTKLFTALSGKQQHAASGQSLPYGCPSHLVLSCYYPTVKFRAEQTSQHRCKSFITGLNCFLHKAVVGNYSELLNIYFFFLAYLHPPDSAFFPQHFDTLHVQPLSPVTFCKTQIHLFGVNCIHFR